MTPEADEDFQEEPKPPPAKLGGFELIFIIIFILFIAWGTYEFGIWIIKDGSNIML